MLSVEQLALIVLIGSIVAVVARRVKIPYTVGLVVAGLLLAVLRINFELQFSKELLFKMLLPPLIFEAAINIRWRELRKDLLPITVYATLGVLLSAAVTATLMHVAVGWVWPAAVIFGVLIAATDPVSVIAAFKDAKVGGRLRLLVEAESLFNDSTAAVAFTAALGLGLGQSFGLASTVFSMLWSVAGGIISGLIVGALALLIIGNTRDHLVELAMTTLAAFGSFWLADHFELSGILATTTAGIVVRNVTLFGRISEKGEEYIEYFWDFAAFVVNSVVFVLLGVNVAYPGFASSALTILVAIAAVILGRAVAVYPCSTLFAWSSLKIKREHQHVMFWGGLRGALALALALGIPDSLPYRQEILTVTFGVVGFSVIVQGLTVSLLLRRGRGRREHS
jgi:CPA1 family monovalent cation:H+ antiporter